MWTMEAMAVALVVHYNVGLVVYVVTTSNYMNCIEWGSHGWGHH